MIKPSIYILLLMIELLLYKVQTCGAGQYSSGGTCYSCHYSCNTCIGGTSTDCTSPCVSTRMLVGSSCPCLDGYVEQGTNKNCARINCDFTCLTCNNTATQCTSCQSSDFRSLVGISCPCIDRYYDGGVANCRSCDYTCLTCNGTANTNCLSCNSLAKRSFVSATGKCDCVAGFYDNSTSSQLCAPCDHQCLSCFSRSYNCTQCGANRLTTPSCLCQNKFYDDGSTQACVPCQYSCQACTNGTGCSSCDIANQRVPSNTTYFCLCNIRYYDDGSNQLCLSCHNTCLNCVGPGNTQCTACSFTSFRILSGTTCIPKTGYYQTSPTTELCLKCDSRCLTCLGTATNCTSCDNNLHRSFSLNLCPCDLGFYEDSVLICQLCHYSCQGCINQYSCSNCTVSSLRVVSPITNLCQCPDGYYDDGSPVCAPCNYKCKTCISTAQQCLSCPDNSFRTLINKNCTCNQFYYDDGSSPACLKCHYSCSSCNTSPQCLTCSLAKYRNLTSANLCICLDKFYDNGVIQQCQPCLAQCKTCTNGTNCTSCQPSQYRELISGLCPCMQKHYLQDGICKDCLYHCSTCSTITYCLTCNSTLYRQINFTNSYCVCMTHYYDDGGNNQQCLPCKYTCLTCKDASTCQTCDQINDFRYLTATKQCICKDGYYQSAIGTVTCSLCPYGCNTCSISSGIAKCLTCAVQKQRLLNSSTGTCYCRDTFFDDGTNQQCVACPYACKTCSSLTTCLKCDLTLRQFSLNWCNCFQKYYDDGIDVTCQQCHHSCSTCTSSTSCDTCNITRSRQPSTVGTYCSCLVKWYDDGLNQQCNQCKYQCQTCLNNTVCRTCNPLMYRQNATSLCPCMDRFYDDGNNQELCRPCQYTCKKCTNATQCKSCDSTNHRTFDSTNNLCKCMNKYFDDGFNNQLCIPCIYSCLTCQSSATTCQTCNTSAFRQKIGTDCLCKQYYYDDGRNQLCKACNHTCSTCSDGVSCDTCNITRFRLHNITTDKCICITGYFDDLSNQICVRCHLTCLTCFNGTDCETCDSSRNRILNNTVNIFGISSQYCVCFDKYYDPSPDQNCLPCHYSCQICSGGLPNQCQKCNSTAHRYMNIATSQCLCSITYFDNGIDEQCNDCDFKCKQCFQRYQTNCTQCQPTYYYLADQNTCFVNCPQYYYNNTLNMICTACSQYCITCITTNICYQCQIGKYLFFNLTDHYCTAVCPDRTYPNSTIKQCIICPQGCSLCTDNLHCQSCDTNYYLDIVYNLCYQCNPLCNGCTGPSQDQCLSCNYPMVLMRSKCYQLTCLLGQYIDPINGCTKCINLFSDSLSCNLTQAFTCKSTFHLKNGRCLACQLVFGYKMTSSGACRQICGDGVRLQYQCDDGNLINGDGCSSSCTIQQGWKCNQYSVCELIKPIQFRFFSIFKYGAQNKVRIWLKLSLPVRLSGLFSVTVERVFQQSLSFTYQQNEKDLKDVWFYLSYKQDIQNKKITLKYEQARLLIQQQQIIEFSLQKEQNQNQIYTQIEDKQKIEEYIKNRLLIQITLQTNFTIDSYPPAIYYPQQTFNFHKIIKQYLLIIGIILLVLCFLIIPKKMHLHSVTLIHYPSIIFISAGLLLEQESDFIKSTLYSLKGISFIDGFTLGQCCIETVYFQYKTQIFYNTGIVLFIMIFSWIVYIVTLVYDYYVNKIPKVLSYIYYYAITIQLLLCCHFIYAGGRGIMNSSIINEFDAINISLSLFVLIYSIFMIGLIASFSYYLKISYQNPQNLKSVATLNSHQNDQKIQIKDMDISLTNRFQNGDQISSMKSFQNNNNNNGYAYNYKQLSEKKNNNHNLNNQTKLNNSQFGILLDINNDIDGLSSVDGQIIQLRTNRKSLQTMDVPISPINSNQNRKKLIMNSQIQIQEISEEGLNQINGKNGNSIKRNILKNNNQKKDDKNPQQQVIDKSDQIYKDLPYDYHTLYSKQKKYSRFFLPFYLFKIWIFSIVTSFGHGYHFYVYIILIVVNIIFLVGMIKIRPFESTLTNFRIILLEILMALFFAVCLVYSLFSGQKNYIYSVQLSIVIGSLIILSLATLFAIIQHLLSWKTEIRNIIQPCLISLRLRGKKKIFDVKPKRKNRQAIKAQQIKIEETQEPKQQLDAFYARMIKKQKLNQIYKKQRHVN